MNTATGVFQVTIPGTDVPSDLAAGTITVPSTASLSISGSGTSQPLLDISFVVQGSLSLTRCSGRVNGLTIEAAAFSMDADSAALLNGPLMVTGTDVPATASFLGADIQLSDVTMSFGDGRLTATIQRSRDQRKSPHILMTTSQLTVAECGGTFQSASEPGLRVPAGANMLMLDCAFRFLHRARWASRFWVPPE